LREVIITLLAGKLTPAARVEVQKIAFITPYLNRYSTPSLSSIDSPLWWNATPFEASARRLLFMFSLSKLMSSCFSSESGPIASDVGQAKVKQSYSQ